MLCRVRLAVAEGSQGLARFALHLSLAIKSSAALVCLTLSCAQDAQPLAKTLPAGSAHHLCIVTLCSLEFEFGHGWKKQKSPQEWAGADQDQRGDNWMRRQDSNLRPPAYEAGELPAAPRHWKRKSPSGVAEALEILGAAIPTRWLLCQKSRVRQYHRTPFSIKPRVSMLRASRFSTCSSAGLLGRRGLDQTFAPVARLRAINAMAVRCG